MLTAMSASMLNSNAISYVKLKNQTLSKARKQSSILLMLLSVCLGLVAGAKPLSDH